MAVSWASRTWAGACTTRHCRRTVSASPCGCHCHVPAAAPPSPRLPALVCLSSPASKQIPLLWIDENASAPCPPSIICSSRKSAKPILSTRKCSSFARSAMEGDSTSSSSTADADISSPDTESQGADSGDAEQQENIGKGLTQEKFISGVESPSKTEEFWRGVLEETRLIEWPSLRKVLGTTGVVTSIIVGSSLVLLTVNALLAQLSDVIFLSPPPS